MLLGFMIEDQTFPGPLLLQTRGNILWKDVPPAGILLHGSDVAVFATRAEARAAIARTQDYMRAHPLPGGRPEHQYKISRLVPATQE